MTTASMKSDPPTMMMMMADPPTPPMAPPEEPPEELPTEPPTTTEFPTLPPIPTTPEPEVVMHPTNECEDGSLCPHKVVVRMPTFQRMQHSQHACHP